MPRRATLEGAAPTGAYGFTVTGVRTARDAGLVAVPDSGRWPTLAIGWQLGIDGRPADHLVGQDPAVLLLVDGEFVNLDLARGRATFHVRREPTDHDLVHPYLAAPAALAARQHGRVPIHAGGLLVDGGAWAILGEKGAGKTTILSACHALGFGVLADDLVVVDGSTAYAGPRGLDLRPETAARADVSEGLVEVRGGDRWRLPLPSVPSEVPFRGCVVLADGDRLAMTLVPLARRLELLGPHVLVGEHTQRSFLDLVALPVFLLERPKDWRRLLGTVDLLATRLAEHSPA
jgi:hypothetical protein